MTKVMTLIVIAENLKSEASLNEVLTIEYERGTHSGYGLEVGEKLTVKDLIYAAILQSDGVACLTLADYIAGSEANFVQLMNEKAKEMGIGDSTLFQNCTGLHHKYHYSTCRDVAIMMAYAMKNPLCTSVLTSLKYTPSDNFRPSAGATFWHTFLHNQISDGNIQPKNAEIIGGKTGWTGNDSGYCIASYVKGDNGHYYVSVTAKAGSWQANVQDILNIFNEYVE
jgi:D-alanyl-D-alanine carboxypeptidase (penicillin-binding protein 5/6)